LEPTKNILQELVQKAVKGEASAQALLYQQFSKAMFHICLRMSKNKNGAEDILQDSFILAFKNLHQLKDATQFGGWLKRIVVNECIRQTKQSWQWQDWEEQHDQISIEQEAEWWKTVNIEMVYQQIKALPEGCKQVFNLFVFEDYTHKEIAGLLSISESTSKSQYHRARQLLKNKINQQMAIHG
jgi:RNA polymerase sigma-70 factor (ECF subfamily)